MIAIPAINNVIQNSKDKAILSDASQIISSAKIAISDGACTESGATITCNKAALEDYVDGIVLDADDKVVQNAKTTTKAISYVVTYKKLETLANKERKTKAAKAFQTDKTTDTSIASDKLASIMGN